MTSTILQPHSKICTRCKKEKVFSEFHSSGMKSDGTKKYHTRCKECYHEIYAETYIPKRPKSGNRRNVVRPGKKGRNENMQKRLAAPDGMAYCSRCGTYKDKCEFSKKGKAKSGVWYVCKKCINKAQNQKGYFVDRLNQYGLTRDQHAAMLEKQNGVCAICGKTQKTSDGQSITLSIDHDHHTGKVRGLLCNPCNLALGNFGDSIDNLIRAVEYMRQYSE